MTHTRMDRSQKILIVDDEAAVLRAITMVFEHAGFEVVTARNPEEALDRWRCERGEIQVVLADLELNSSITGEQLCEFIHFEAPELLTIVLTAYPVDGRRLGRIDGVNFFQKPFDIHALVAAVGEFLQLPSGASPALQTSQGGVRGVTGHRRRTDGPRASLDLMLSVSR